MKNKLKSTKSIFVFLIIITFLAALPAIGARATYGAKTTADEPQYLLTALSIAEDFDLDISDEIADRRFTPWHEINLNQQTIALNETNQRISPHDPLLPVLLAPAMAIGGWTSAKIFLAMMSSATAAMTLALVTKRWRLSSLPAALVIAAFFCSPPLVAYGTQVYPEMPAALAVLIATFAITGSTTNKNLAVASISMISLPWLSVKYVPVAAILALFILWQTWHSARRRAVATALFLAISGIIFLIVHQRIYGGWTVYASGDHFVNGKEFEVVGESWNPLGRTRRVIGLLIDRGFGLAAWAPAFLFAPAALVLAYARKDKDSFLVLGLISVGWANATWVALTMHGWWWPGRQVVVVLPLVVALIASLAERHKQLMKPILLASLFSIFSWFWLVLEASTGRRTLIFDFEQTSNPAFRIWRFLLPDHQRMNSLDITITTIWLVAIIFTAWLECRAWITSTKKADAHATDTVLKDHLLD